MAELSVALRLVVESGVLEGSRVIGGMPVAVDGDEDTPHAQRKIDILEWFNSKVVGEKIELNWR